MKKRLLLFLFVLLISCGLAHALGWTLTDMDDAGSLTPVRVEIWEHERDLDVSAATRYYPSSTTESGRMLNGASQLSIGFDVHSGVTLTVEGSMDSSAEYPNAPTDWIDITKSGLRLTDHSTGNASFVNEADILVFTDLPIARWRIKVVTSDASNGIIIRYLQK